MNIWQLPGWKSGVLKIGNTKYYLRINIVSLKKDMGVTEGYGGRQSCRRERELGPLGVNTQPSMPYPGVVHFLRAAEPYLDLLKQLRKTGY
jgi:hypothetical protein